MIEEWVNSDLVYRGSIFRIRVGEVRLDDGAVALREVVEHPGGVAVVPFDGRSVMLCRQYRIAVAREVLEIPAGKLEKGDDPAFRAARELQEELGLTAETLTPVGGIHASVGYTSEFIHMFLAFGLQESAQELEEDERIQPVVMPLEDARKALTDNSLTDAKTVVGLRALFDHLERHPELVD